MRTPSLLTPRDAALTAATTGDGALTYASDAPDVAAVDENTGALTLAWPAPPPSPSLRQRPTSSRQRKSRSPFTVTKAKQTITGVEEALDLKYKSKGTYQLQAKAATALTYKSSDTSVATVDKKGKLTMQGLGTVVITITAKEDGSYTKATHKVEIEIYKTAAKLKVSKYYKKSKFYKRLMKLRMDGTTRQNVMAIAETQVGYHEGNKSAR